MFISLDVPVYRRKEDQEHEQQRGIIPIRHSTRYEHLQHRDLLQMIWKTTSRTILSVPQVARSATQQRTVKKLSREETNGSLFTMSRRQEVSHHRSRYRQH